MATTTIIQIAFTYNLPKVAMRTITVRVYYYRLRV